MLSKSQIKLITSLKQKKFRQQYQLFAAEGRKTINELLNSRFNLHQLYSITSEFKVSDDLTTIITPTELHKISFLKTPNTALALFKMPKSEVIKQNGLIVALDDVRDPGNLGTIIRLCDWFGIEELICSIETVDCYNPKVVQATMGSLARVNISYDNLNEFLSTTSLPVYGTFMDGESIYDFPVKSNGILLLGNEANGISESLQEHISTRLTIPRFGNLKQTESLNVANATAICLSEFKRRSIEK